MAEMVRKHFILPRALAEEFERVAGERKQSERLAEALELWLRNQHSAISALAELAATPPRGEYPGWEDDHAIPEWVAKERAGWDREVRA